MNTVWQYILGYLQLFKITDLIDIVIVAIIIFYLIKLLRETRAVQLIKGIALLFAIFVLSDWLRLNTLHYILASTIQIGAFALVVIFQPELRNMLERMGRVTVGSLIDFGTAQDTDDTNMMIESVVKAAGDMARTRTGALIVIERETKLGDYIRTGTKIDAAVSSRLLENIFVPNTPLPDGAVIISKNRAAAASCLLPLTSNNTLSLDLGTRHRAAVGLSECTDAIIIVVSEETGRISMALGGALSRNMTDQKLTDELSRLLTASRPDGEIREKFRFRRSK